MPEAQAKAKASSGSAARLQLISAAERLFARSGIDAVSLRQINVAAGQKNSSAAHYHFGSKETLILAIYSARMENVNARRLDAITKLEAENQLNDVRALVYTIVQPIVDEIEADPSGRSYIAFMAQAIGHPQLDLAELWQQDHNEGLSKIIKFLADALPDLPEPIFGQRFGLAFEQIVHSLADREKLRKGDDEFQVDGDLFVSNLIDCISGAMSAPLSAATQENLQRLK
jgi:AcrR family transcriptional regulator